MAQWKEGMWCIGWVGLFTAWRCYIAESTASCGVFFSYKKNWDMSAIITSHLNPYYSFSVSQNGTNGRRIQ